MTEATTNGTLRKAYDNNGLKDTPIRTATSRCSPIGPSVQRVHRTLSSGEVDRFARCEIVGALRDGALTALSTGDDSAAVALQSIASMF